MPVLPDAGTEHAGTEHAGTEHAGTEHAGTEREPGKGLVGFLDLEHVARDLFHGWCHDGLPSRAFGGQVAAQALAAAGRTVPEGRQVHSVHGHFLRTGDTAHPFVYEVERIRDGSSYLTRRATARQGGDVVFTLTASFKRPESAEDRQPPMPRTPDPGTFPDLYEIWAKNNPEDFERAQFRHVLDMRYVPGPAEPNTPGMTEQKLWMRATERLPDDPMLHASALAYASDLFLAPTASLASEPPRMLRTGPASVFLTSLDHAIWFHRPFRADEWLLFCQRSPSASDGRGLAFAEVWNRDGRLIAHVVQEAVVRPLRSRSS
ncbi:acyl-CoA thioesterase [Streptomyces sp. NPDC055749]